MLLLKVHLELTFSQYVAIGRQYLPSSQPLQSMTPLESFPLVPWLFNTLI